MEGKRTLRIPLPLPGLNDIIGTSQVHWGRYGKMKRKWGQTVGLYAKSQGFAKIAVPSHFEFEWLEASRKRDPDNVSAGGRKIILDALQDCELLENDNATWVLSFMDTFQYGKGVGVVLTVR